tara:strand:+ start:1938 stop:2720 length:783 start_codon:yes stop_codon:yes gene_type:complete
MLITFRNYRLYVREYTIAIPTLPPVADGFRLCFLSDLHIGSVPGIEDMIAEQMADLHHDVVILGGDFFCERHDVLCAPPSPADWAPAARRLVAAADPHGAVFAVYGNHDHSDLPGVFENEGITNVEGRTVDLIGNAAEGVTLTGIPFTEQGLTDLHLGSAPDVERFNILLTHSPDFAPAACDRGYDLFLCGHTHAGQVCLPGGHMVLRSANAPRRICARQWAMGDMAGFTSPGIGTSFLPIRMFCDPEIAVLTLRRQAPD